MAITQTTLAANSLVTPRYQKITQDPDTSFIIIDDITPAGIEAHVEINRSPAWLKIEADDQVTTLSAAPSGITQVGSHQPWNRLSLLVKGGETLVVEYSALPMNAANQQSVTAYQLNTNDILYVKIDRSANTATIYGNAGLSA